MSNTITLVTTTRNRPIAFNFLQDHISRQTLAHDRWIVINDGIEPYEYRCGQEVVQRDPKNDKLPSINENWLAALPLIGADDTVLVIEDDDFYSEKYISRLAGLLESVDLAGINDARYFNLESCRYLNLGNTEMAVLASTGFRASYIPEFRKAVESGSIFIDVSLWNAAVVGRLVSNGDGMPLQIGLKGLPLSPGGLGLGHDHRAGIHDPSYSQLRKWMGAEAERYIEASRTYRERPRC